MSPVIYLVTGAARGIGFALVTQLSSSTNNIVFAGVRALPLEESSQLAQLVRAKPNIVFPILISSANEADNRAAARVVKDKAGRIDVIIACAGKSSGLIPVHQVTSSIMIDDFTINTIGPLILYQSFAPLLQASAESQGNPKFVIIGSSGGQITEMAPFPITSYGVSKAGANYLAKKINQEVEEIASFSICPGFVDTDMARGGAQDSGNAKNSGMAAGWITPEESATGLLRVVDQASKSSHGGKFWQHSGEEKTF